MKKRFLTVAAATVMSMAFAMTAFAEAPEGYTAFYGFDGDLKNAADDSEATVTGDKVYTEGTGAAKFAEGVNGQALDLDATYGLKLGQYITQEQYTVSYNVLLRNTTFGTAGVFVESMTGSAAKELWDSIMPETEAGQGFVPRVWSNDNAGHRYNLYMTNDDIKGRVHDDNDGKWTNITFVKGEQYGCLYVNGEIVAKGFTESYANSVGADPSCSTTITADTVEWLGVNYWDAPLDALVDDLYIYDKALTDDEVAALTGCEVKDSIGELEIPKFEAPKVDDTDWGAPVNNDKASDEGMSGDTLTIIISAVIVAVAVVICIVVIASSKKKKTE